jgi:LacI family transcriptional regulator
MIINGKPRASQSTIDAVRQAMDDLGYVPRPPDKRPGPRIKSEKPTRIGRVAMLFCNLAPTVIRSPLNTGLLHGIEEALSRDDMSMVMRAVAQSAMLPREVVDRRVDGTIVTGVEAADDVDPVLRKTPLVQAMGTYCGIGDSIEPDNEAAGRLAATYLLERGHRRCACISEQKHPALELRVDAYCRAISAAGGTTGVAGDARLAVVTPERHEGDREKLGRAIDKLLSLDPRPTALFVPADVLTPTVYSLLYEREILPGRDVEVVSCNNEVPLLSGLHPRPAVVDIQIETIGRRCVEQLFWRVDHPAEPLARILVVPRLVTEGVAESVLSVLTD